MEDKNNSSDKGGDKSEDTGGSGSDSKSGEDSGTDEGVDWETPKKGDIDCSKLKADGGTEIGDIPDNLTFMAANGKSVSLHEHCNSVILLMTGTAH